MTDMRTSERIRVLDGGYGGLYIRVAMSQLEEVRKTLDRHGIFYWVDSVAVSLNGKPAVIAINLGRNNDADRVQAILDEAD